MSESLGLYENIDELDVDMKLLIAQEVVSRIYRNGVDLDVITASLERIVLEGGWR